MSYDGDTALALDDQFLREVAGMASNEDSASIQSLPVLKINYDPDSTHPQGAWVVGQKKKDDAIIEEGELVKGLVILAIRNRYSYYVESDTNKNCNSPLHMQGDTVRGSNYKQICGKGCSKRAEGLDPRCQAQRAVFGLALTEDNKMVECVAYIKGANYMPLTEYVEKMTKIKAGSKMVTVPTFTFLTQLGSVKKKNGSVVYWVGEYTKGPSFSIEQIRQFEEKRHQVQAYIDSLNANISSEVASEKPSHLSLVKGGSGEKVEVVDDIPDFSAARKSSPIEAEVVEDIPFNVTPTSPPDDIEAAIAKAMEGLK